MPVKLEFLPRLESLRGIAAVAVVGYHAYGLCNDTAVTGMGPVVLFFVLSGFVLARSLEKNATPLTFFRHRIFRDSCRDGACRARQVNGAGNQCPCERRG